MKHLFSIFIFFIYCVDMLFAQHNVQFIVKELTARKHDTIYITGNFNNWDSANKKYKLKPFDAEHKYIVLNLPEGKCEYKFTHGTWLTIEKDIDCGEMENRVANIRKDTIINIIIENWKDICFYENFTIPELRQKFKIEKSDSNKARILIDLSYKSLDDYKEASKYAEEALTFAKKSNFKKGMAWAYRLTGQIFSNQNNYTKARSNYLLALKICEEVNDKILSNYISEEIGNSYENEGKYDEAARFYYANLRKYEKRGEYASIARMLFNIAGIHSKQGNNSESLKKYKESLISFQESWELYKEDWLRSYIALCYDYIANEYTNLGNYAEAMRNDSLGLKIFKETNNIGGMSRVLSSMGIVSRKHGLAASMAGDKSLASLKFKEALQILEESMKIQESPRAYINAGKIYTFQKNFSKAKIYLEKGLSLSREGASKEGIIQSFNALSELDSAQGNFKQAYDHYKMYILCRDSLINEESTKKSEIYKNSYEFNKKEDQIKLLTTENELKTTLASKQKQQKNFAYAGIAAILLTGGYGFYRYRRRKKLQSQQAVLSERLRISSELHDEVGATLSGIAMYSHLTKEQMRKGQTAEIEKSLNVMQQSSAQMVDKLNDIVWLINPDQDSLQKLVERLEEYARDMAAIKNMQVKIIVPDKIGELSLLVESRRNIYLFCKEAINNSVKYSNGSLLELKIKEVGGKLEFSVSDNGKGFDAVMVRRGNGLENMQKRADEIGAKLVLHSKEKEGVYVCLQCNT
ncbi:MAG: histidine kinase [Chitinophagaceae bacterium]